jgi:hypothetical protein
MKPTPEAMPPDRSSLTPTDRLAEVAEILAAGILRVRARHRTPKGSRRETVSVDFSPDRSGHASPSGTRRKRHGRT